MKRNREKGRMRNLKQRKQIKRRQTNPIDKEEIRPKGNLDQVMKTK